VKQRATNELRNLRTLADFSNLETAEQADYFRHNYREFLPEEFWRPGVLLAGKRGPSDWRYLQSGVRAAWREKFPPDACLSLIVFLAISPEQIEGSESVKVWPYQKAIMTLATEPWRARFCKSCGNRYVADKPGRVFCSDSCAKEARKLSKRISWTKHRDEWRGSKKRQRGRRQAQ